MAADEPHVTGLLRAWQRGDARAADELVPLVCAHLRSIAANRLHAERDGHTLQPTALVHEARLRLMRQHGADRLDVDELADVIASPMPDDRLVAL